MNLVPRVRFDVRYLAPFSRQRVFANLYYIDPGPRTDSSARRLVLQVGTYTVQECGHGLFVFR